jgi:hypothetical protein
MQLTPIPEPDRPTQALLDSPGLHRRAERHKVSIAPHVDGLLRAELDAGVTLGAHLRFLIEALVDIRTQHHQVVGTDVDAQWSLMDIDAGVTGLRIDIRWHGFLPYRLYSSSHDPRIRSAVTPGIWKAQSDPGWWKAHAMRAATGLDAARCDSVSLYDTIVVTRSRPAASQAARPPTKSAIAVIPWFARMLAAMAER